MSDHERQAQRGEQRRHDRVQHGDRQRGDERAEEAVDGCARDDPGGDEQGRGGDEPRDEEVQRPELRPARPPARSVVGLFAAADHRRSRRLFRETLRRASSEGGDERGRSRGIRSGRTWFERAHLAGAQHRRDRRGRHAASSPTPCCGGGSGTCAGTRPSTPATSTGSSSRTRTSTTSTVARCAASTGRCRSSRRQAPASCCGAGGTRRCREADAGDELELGGLARARDAGRARVEPRARSRRRRTRSATWCRARRASTSPATPTSSPGWPSSARWTCRAARLGLGPEAAARPPRPARRGRGAAAAAAAARGPGPLGHLRHAVRRAARRRAGASSSPARPRELAPEVDVRVLAIGETLELEAAR